MSDAIPVDLGLSISIALFVLSFSWLFVQRTEGYPSIHRLAAIFSNGLVPDMSSNNSQVVVLSYIYIIFWIAVTSWSFLQYAILLKPAVTQTVISLLLGPIFYFLAPQAISASTTLLILWLVPEDHDEDQYPALKPYVEGNKARNYFTLSFVISIGLVYGLPLVLFLIS